MKTKIIILIFLVAILQSKTEQGIIIINTPVVLSFDLYAFTFYPFIFTSDEMDGCQHCVNHEMIHARQQIELFVIIFYVWYCVEYFVKRCMYGKKAHHYISFERECYANEKNFTYIENRKWYSFLKYL